MGSRLERVNRSARPTLGAPDARRGPRPRVHGRWHGRGGDEEGGERSGEGEALT